MLTVIGGEAESLPQPDMTSKRLKLTMARKYLALRLRLTMAIMMPTHVVLYC